MAITPIHNPIPTLVYSPIPKIAFRKISNDPSRSLPSLSSSRSRPRSLAVKCCNNNNGNAKASNSSDAFGLKSLLSGLVDELLNTEEVDNFMSGFIDDLIKDGNNRVLVESLAKASRELAQQETEIEKMKQIINQLKTRSAQIERCQKKLAEVKAVVEEAESSLQVVTHILSN